MIVWHCLVLVLIANFFYVDMSQNQSQGNVQLNKNEGDEKKKEKSHMTWHRIVCDGSVKKRIRRLRCTNSRG